MILIQESDFDLNQEVAELRQASPETGAIVTFSGLVREWCSEGQIQSLYLEHYPGMTESSIQVIVDEAFERWNLLSSRVIHRVGGIVHSRERRQG